MQAQYYYVLFFTVLYFHASVDKSQASLLSLKQCGKVSSVTHLK